MAGHYAPYFAITSHGRCREQKEEIYIYKMILNLIASKISSTSSGISVSSGVGELNQYRISFELILNFPYHHATSPPRQVVPVALPDYNRL